MRTRSRILSGRLANCALLVTTIALLVFSQSPFDHGWLGTIALVPWFLVAKRSGAAMAAIQGVAIGIVFGLTSAGWVVAAFESQGARGPGALFAAVITALWAKGLLFSGLGWLIDRLRGCATGIQVLAPAIFGGLTEMWIADSRWGLPLLLFGHSQFSIPGVAQLAVVIGVPGISVLLIAVNASLAIAVVGRRVDWRHAVAWGSAWISMATSGTWIAQCFEVDSMSPLRRLLIVQPDFQHSWRWDPAFQGLMLDEISTQTTRALDLLESRPDVILWPETLLTIPVAPELRSGRRLQRAVDTWRVPVVLGVLRQSLSGAPLRYRNSVLWWSPSIGPRVSVDKARAIPVVESSRTFWGRALLDRMVGEAADGPRVVEAEVEGTLLGEFALVPALCFEVLFPRIIAERRSAESVAIVNLADDSWVRGEVVDAQLIAASAFRAIEQRLTLLRVAHGGLSVVIDPFGRVIARLDPDATGELLVEASARPPPSRAEKVAILLMPFGAGLLAWSVWPFAAAGNSRRVPRRLESVDPRYGFEP